MTHTKKRILAMLLAVVLMFGTLPFSVSADEITINDSSGDVPVLYAQDPFNTVKSEVEGGTNYMTSVGVTREAIVRELESHEARIKTLEVKPAKLWDKLVYALLGALASGFAALIVNMAVK